ncbi:MAG TPA: ester cyclase [Chthoniobacterales bacterium]|nr:ester cyclase [Chthoniobacterales bacterium]
MSETAENRQVVEVINAVLSGEKPIAALDTVIADDFHDHAAFPGQRPGRAGFADAVGNLRAAFDQKVRSLHTAAEGDLVIDHWVSEGVHRGAFFGIEPTGKNVRIEGFSVWRIVDGRAAEAWGLVDIAGLMRQLKA